MHAIFLPTIRGAALPARCHTRLSEAEPSKMHHTGRERPTKVHQVHRFHPYETKRPRYTVGCGGPEATRYAESVLSGQHVAVEVDPGQDTHDRYGRTLAASSSQAVVTTLLRPFVRVMRARTSTVVVRAAEPARSWRLSVRRNRLASGQLRGGIQMNGFPTDSACATNCRRHSDQLDGRVVSIAASMDMHCPIMKP